ncbi:MAG: UDP-2,3-diacylglucosamine diphosphatase LpxI [Pseudomonadota bacterium]
MPPENSDRPNQSHQHGDPGPPTPLAIVAGKGSLPQQLAEARAGAGLPYLLVIFPGCALPWMRDHPNQHHEFERVGRIFAALAESRVTHIVFAGAMLRPRLRPWRADWPALKLLAHSLRLLTQGDDAMLRGFGAVFEARGIRLIGPQAVLGGALMVPAGALGRVGPRPQDLTDARRAAQIVAALGPLDVGQAAAVAGGLCLGVEAIGGTDLMLAQIAALPPERRRAARPPSGVLYKGPKPGQDRRFDVPTIGPETVRAAAAAGLSGIVVAAGATQLLDLDVTRAEADRLGLFVYAATDEELAEAP